MAGNFWFNYIMALVVVALMLGGLYALTRGLARGRLLLSTKRRLVTVLESTPLAQHAAMHVVKAGNRYYLIGASNGQLNSLAELPAEEVDAWLSEQRTSLDAQRLPFVEAMRFLRRRP